MGTRHGIVLIMVSLLLVLVTTLALLFVRVSSLQRLLMLNSKESVRSRLLAKSGLERAFAELTHGSQPSYGGEDYDGSGRLDVAQETDSQVFRPAAFDVEGCPPEVALRPSFFPSQDGRTMGGRRVPDLTEVGGKLLSYSGRLRGTYVDRRFSVAAPALRGDVYTLKVEDESAKINVNGGFLDDRGRDPDVQMDWADPDVVDAAGQGHGWNRQLARILDLLGTVQEIDLNGSGSLSPYEDWNGNGVFDPPPIGIASMGQTILAGRPSGGYRSIEQVQAVLGTAVDLSPYLTVHSWVDRAVIRPNAWRLTAHLHAVNDEKKLRGALLPEEEGRSPVHLNAAPRPVLVALLQGIRAPAELTCNTEWMAFTGATTYRVSAQQAGRIAERIVASRPFAGWGAFRVFLDGLVNPQGGLPAAISGFPTTLSGGVPALCMQLGPAHMILANFDPNTHANEQYPDAALWQWLDKADLLDYSTEGTLHPTGAYRIASAGRIVDAKGMVRAQTAVSVLSDVYRLVRHTTQRDFMAGRQAGVEDPPGSGLYPLSLAPAGQFTAGRSAGVEWWGAAPPGRGASVMTYPCPPVAVAAGNAADFDGYVGLATVEAENTLPALLDPPEPSWSVRFLHHFDGDGCSAADGGWNADVAIDPARRVGPIESGPFPGTLCDRYLPVGAALRASSWPSSGEPSTLLPDGIHLQESRCPAFSAGNLPEDFDILPLSDHAVINFWVKRVNHSSTGAWRRSLTDMLVQRYKDPIPLPTTFTHAVMVGCMGMYEPGIATEVIAGILAENSAMDQDRDDISEQHHDVLIDPVYAYPGGRWWLMTAIYDTDEANTLGLAAHDAHLTLRCAHPYGGGAEHYAYPTNAFNYKDLPPMEGGTVSFTFTPVGESLVYAPGTRTIDPTCALVLGGGRDPYIQNHVLDEFSIYDLGDDGAKAHRNADFLADERFQDGRYYKGDTAAFLSAAVTPFAGRPARILFARWTDRLPTEATLEPRVLGGASYTPRWLDPLLVGNDGTGKPRVRVELELLDGTGTPLRPLVQGETIGLTLPSFRYRARFRTVLADPLNPPVLETPYLDDITFACQGPEGPRVLVWTE